MLRSWTEWNGVCCQVHDPFVDVLTIHHYRKTTTMMFKMLLIDRTHQIAAKDLAKPRQLFVTQSRVLAMKVQEYFSRLTNSLSISASSVQQLHELQDVRTSTADIDLIDADDIVNWRSDLPTRFSELTDNHFPVITTVDQVMHIKTGLLHS